MEEGLVIPEMKAGAVSSGGSFENLTGSLALIP